MESNENFEKSLNEKIQSTADSFIQWRDGLRSENRGGVVMYDVPNHYKWLDTTELFQYYMDFINPHKND